MTDLQVKELIKKYKKEFSVKENNSSPKGITRSNLREELIPALEKRLSESPNFMKQKLNTPITTASGHTYSPIFKRKK